MAYDGNGRFDDHELDKLLAAMSDADTRLSYFEALFRELVAGARDADDDDERERYGMQALVVSCALTAARASHDVDVLKRTLIDHADESAADRRMQIETATDRGIAQVVEAVTAAIDTLTACRGGSRA
jgi:hypothetical protein